MVLTRDRHRHRHRHRPRHRHRHHKTRFISPWPQLFAQLPHSTNPAARAGPVANRDSEALTRPVATVANREAWLKSNEHIR